MPDSAPTPADDAAPASIAQGSLVWRIKSSLIGYVRGMSDGEVLLDDGVVETADGFAFPANGVDGDTLRFGGVVTFQGHNGMMRVELSEPSLTRVGDGWRVEFSDPDAPTVRLHFADVASVVTGPDGTVHGTGTFLAADGADLFFGPYEQGTPLDDPFVQGWDGPAVVDLAWWEVETPWPDRFREFDGAMWGWTFEPEFEDAGIGRSWIVKEHTLEATLADAVAHGASIERERSGPGGDDKWFATFRDPAGVSWGLWTEQEAASTTGMAPS